MFKFGLLYFLLAKIKSETEGKISIHFYNTNTACFFTTTDWVKDGLSVFLVSWPWIKVEVLFEAFAFELKSNMSKSRKVCTDACNCFSNQIEEDLKIWSDGINRDAVEKAASITNAVHYQIIDGHIYRSD